MKFSQVKVVPAPTQSQDKVMASPPKKTTLLPRSPRIMPRMASLELPRTSGGCGPLSTKSSHSTKSSESLTAGRPPRSTTDRIPLGLLSTRSAPSIGMSFTNPPTPGLMTPGSAAKAEYARTDVWVQMIEESIVEEGMTIESALDVIVKENVKTLDEDLVLPCAPSDDEKKAYYATGRLFLVTFGVISLAALSAGMWLFVLSSVYFYWFGVPAAFFMIYLLLSYFGIAVWGKDFDPLEHAEVLATATEQAFFPTVDVFLPCCGEPLCMLENTYKYMRTLDYPHVAIHVLDDGGTEEVRHLAQLHGFNYIRRANRPVLKKAGNLRWAFEQTMGDLIVIFDADFCPRADFLTETVPYFIDEEIAIVQTPQFFRHQAKQTWVERGAGVTQELFYRMVQVNRNRFAASICVGTCGVYRRKALEPFGGTAAIGYSEDVHTGFNCTQLGYSVRYVPLCLAMGTCPSEPRAFFVQQYRWCMGSTTLLLNKEFWHSQLTFMQKQCYLSGMFYYSATAIGIFVGPIPGVLLIWFKPSAVFWYNVSFAVPSIAFSVFAMRLWSKHKYDSACNRVKILQYFAHLFAIKDKLMGTAIPWIPTGGGAASRSSSSAYDSAMKLMVIWVTLHTGFVIAGTMWRFTQFPWYHFLPTLVLALSNYVQSISVLF